MLLTVMWIDRSGTLPSYRNFYLGCCYWRALCIIGCGKVYGTKPMAYVYNIIKVCNFTGAFMLDHYLGAVSHVSTGNVRGVICPFS